MAKLSVNDLEVRGKRVLVRVDYNLPMEEKEGRMVITDLTRIKETVPTLELLIEKGARLILVSHLGRPQGKPDPSMSLRPFTTRKRPTTRRSPRSWRGWPMFT
jgi:phosphoglycerate kinase